MTAPPFNRVAILGFGLIGGSLARALAEKKLAIHVAAYDTSEEALAWGVAQGVLHAHHARAADAVQKADLVVLAAPPSAFPALMQEIAPFLGKGTIVTDVASVKRAAIAAIRPLIPQHAHYVPAHPIAGSEKTGPMAGHTDLFLGRRVILTPEEADVLGEPEGRIRSLWNAVGARVEFMPADLHDRVYAYVSHLPQLIAFAAGKVLQDVNRNNDDLLRRFMRLRFSDPGLWTDVALANADFISEALTDFIAFITQITGELAQENVETEDDTARAATLYSKVVATCIIATASLLQELTDVHPAHYAGAGFADMTAPATEDPDEALAAISMHNRQIARWLTATLQNLHAVAEAIRLQDRRKLLELFRQETLHA